MVKQNIHPGEVLREEFLRPMNLTAEELAKSTGMQLIRINQILDEKEPITADTATRLSRFLGTTEAFWINLQREYGRRRSKRHQADS